MREFANTIFFNQNSCVLFGGVIMKVINIKNDFNYLKEYARFCYLKWSNKEKKLSEYIEYKVNKIQTDDKVISILGLVDNSKLIGFISLFKYDGEEMKSLTPWYATMYIKKDYRGNGYSRILNDAVLNEARKLGYNKVYLKSDLVNYYEKFGAKYIKKLKDGENLYYIDL